MTFHYHIRNPTPEEVREFYRNELTQGYSYPSDESMDRLIRELDEAQERVLARKAEKTKVVKF